MESVTSIKLGLSEKLRDPDYFNKFFDERTRDELAEQIRELRDVRKLNQSEFANLAGMKQSAVSRIEQSDYAGWTYKTLLRVASALRARVKIVFILSEHVIDEYRKREAEQREAEIEIEKMEVGNQDRPKLANAFSDRGGDGLHMAIKNQSEQPRENKTIKQLISAI